MLALAFAAWTLPAEARGGGRDGGHTTAVGTTHRATVDIFRVDPVRLTRAGPTTGPTADTAGTNSGSP